MLEIVFGQSAAGGLKAAQRYGEGAYRGGAIAVLTASGENLSPKQQSDLRKQAETRARRDWENAVPLGGKPSDVMALELALSVGDIDEPTPDAKRLAALEMLAPPDHARRTLQAAQKALEQIRARAAEGETLRVWYSHCPDELCGLCWLCACLTDFPDAAIVTVALPEGAARTPDGNWVRYQSWGEVNPGDWGRLSRAQAALPDALRRALAWRWTELCRENAPLRAVLNGQLVSAPETLYDAFLLRTADAQREPVFTVAALIGDTLGRYPLGVGDGWYARRVRALLQTGALEAVEDAEDTPFYRRCLRRGVRR